MAPQDTAMVASTRPNYKVQNTILGISVGVIAVLIVRRIWESSNERQAARQAKRNDPWTSTSAWRPKPKQKPAPRPKPQPRPKPRPTPRGNDNECEGDDIVNNNNNNTTTRYVNKTQSVPIPVRRDHGDDNTVFDWEKFEDEWIHQHSDTEAVSLVSETEDELENFIFPVVDVPGRRRRGDEKRGIEIQETSISDVD